ncbi:TauD/TfdA family dioxygenase [Ahniella affigens]|nr:TauD/TfdA family dioxygenase [Ahniella affigens]
MDQPAVAADEVEIGVPQGAHALPVLIRRLGFGVDLVTWAVAHQELLERLLLRHGALVFQGFKINGSTHFEQLIAKLYQRELLEYTNRSTPRTQVKGRIYTSTEYPPDETIPLHNENAYTSAWPSRVFFFCMTPSSQGGETTIADSRRVLARISPATRARFERLGVRYVRNYGVLDLPWHEVFQTHDKGEVESFCHQRGISCTWQSDGGLRTEEVCQATTVHPVTGESVWFNQAHLFHVSSLKSDVRDALVDSMPESAWPRNAYYGDGSAIEPDVLAEIRQAFDAETVARPWQAGDVLLVDNVLAAHGRKPFTGTRKVLVGMV